MLLSIIHSYMNTNKKKLSSNKEGYKKLFFSCLREWKRPTLKYPFGDSKKRKKRNKKTTFFISNIGGGEGREEC